MESENTILDLLFDDADPILNGEEISIDDNNWLMSEKDDVAFPFGFSLDNIFGDAQAESDDTSARSTDCICITLEQQQPATATYRELELTDEEKRHLTKEGIVLPTHYPLTKAEEKELKKVRRKIRNKVSAQDSRKRKKQYVDGLENRVKMCTTQNTLLLKKVESLQKLNRSLSSQLHELRAAVANSTKSAQAGTCVLVLFLSLALFLAPTLKRATDLPPSFANRMAENARTGSSRTLLAFDLKHTVAEDAFNAFNASDFALERRIVLPNKLDVRQWEKI